MAQPSSYEPQIFSEIRDVLNERVMYIDGAMGTMIQSYKLKENDFRGQRYKHHSHDLQGNNDILSITRPDIIQEIHEQYLHAGSDFVETNTFSATRITQANYELDKNPIDVYDINYQSAKLARAACEKYQQLDGRKRYVCGAIGPTNRTLSISPDVNDPSFRNITFIEAVNAYIAQVKALMEAGTDVLLIETIFDTLNAKAVIFAIEEYFNKNPDVERRPIFISSTIVNTSGRTLSGQTIEAFWTSIEHAKPMAVGLNCAFGTKDMKQCIERLGKCSDAYIICYPNAGLPNARGGYDQTGPQMAQEMSDFSKSRLCNIVGSCCGSTPDHIRSIVEIFSKNAPKPLPTSLPNMLRLSGLEQFVLDPSTVRFVNVSKRCNIVRSMLFKKQVLAGNYDKMQNIAINEVKNGAQVIDINFDESLLDSHAVMRKFCNLLATEREAGKVPFMIDSSKFSVIEQGLQCTQGKCIVNSISLKVGEEEFIRRAKIIKQYGAAVVVMALDEEGQAATKEDNICICTRAYNILVEQVNFNSNDIIFDRNIPIVATGIEEHNKYAKDFFETTSVIKKSLPRCHVSSRVSNISFSFRGNNVLRETTHSVFLYHGLLNGTDMDIVNAGVIPIYCDIPENLLQLVEDVFLNRKPENTKNLIEFSLNLDKSSSLGGKGYEEKNKWRALPIHEKLSHALVNGIDKVVHKDVGEARVNTNKSLGVIQGPFIDGMDIVGDLLGAVKMFLTKVINSSRLVKKAVAVLIPYMEAEEEARITEAKAKDNWFLRT